MLAAFHGNSEEVLTLLKEDQHCITHRNICEQTAVHYAIDNGQIRVIDTLLAFEADMPSNNGSAVVDKQNDIVLGFVVATLENYAPHLKHVTLCLC